MEGRSSTIPTASKKMIIVTLNEDRYAYDIHSLVKAFYPEQPWNMVAGLRHRLVHDYDGINWSIIIEVLFEDMEPFVTAVNAILAGM